MSKQLVRRLWVSKVDSKQTVIWLCLSDIVAKSPQADTESKLYYSVFSLWLFIVHCSALTEWGVKPLLCFSTLPDSSAQLLMVTYVWMSVITRNSGIFCLFAALPIRQWPYCCSPGGQSKVGPNQFSGFMEPASVQNVCRNTMYESVTYMGLKNSHILEAIFQAGHMCSQNARSCGAEGYFRWLTDWLTYYSNTSNFLRTEVQIQSETQTLSKSSNITMATQTPDIHFVGTHTRYSSKLTNLDLNRIIEIWCWSGTGWTSRVEAVLEYFKIAHTRQFVKLSDVLSPKYRRRCSRTLIDA